MDRQMLTEEIERYGQFTFSRSQGPGGQHVNKVNTKVQLSLDIQTLTVLNDNQKRRIEVQLSRRLRRTREGLFFLQVQKQRSQLSNREHAVARMAELITEALIPEKQRTKTRPSKAAKLRRLQSKKAHSDKKQQRRPVSSAE
ncbi:MAG: aminoacyl-tRNA hydrolase [Spirochaetia bacterium]|nr:aminoacyl-tRNA hydrolase [Spirochaetia bacterium]MCF7939976.1 aminoacyl-tRNA hydrolase [Spirochaetia bacterium]